MKIAHGNPAELNGCKIAYVLPIIAAEQQIQQLCNIRPSIARVDTRFYETPTWKAFMSRVLIPAFISFIIGLSTATAEEASILVNADNYARAEAAFQFEGMLKRSGEINKLVHVRQPIPLDRQRNMQMNRDTIYSSAVVDISAGASVSFPNAGDRYMSIAIVNEDNYTTAVYHNGESIELTVTEHGTPFVALIARVLVNGNDPQDLKTANDLQDQIEITASSTKPYQRANYDVESRKTTRELFRLLGDGIGEASFCNGKRTEVKETRHKICAAIGWGGLPTYEVVYIKNQKKRALGDYQLRLNDVPVKGFWSISIYNDKGYFQENEYSAYSINNVIAEPNEDGSFTINFGEHKKGRENFLPIMEGWNYVARLYLPSKDVQDGRWLFPEPTLIPK
ncbi:MAG: hypothetical protein ACI89U_001354 [Gammaproteobacteria bacterium]|jgi:hypothetical protein